MIKASVVIPVYNEAHGLWRVLDALKEQTFPQEKFEVIVVDNGSTDNTQEVVSQYEGVQYLLQTEYLNSSFSSRNRGLEIAQGEVIVFLDGTVVPDKTWLEEGLKCMEKRNADMVSSNIRLDYGENITGAKLFDSNNGTIERKVKNRDCAITSSLFVKAILFEKLGKFREGAETAEDPMWTWKATQKGYKLEFCRESKGVKKAKTLRKLLKKQWRDAKGYPPFWELQGKNVPLVKKLARSVLPYSIGRIDKLLQNVKFEVSFYQKVRLYFVAWTISILMSIGHIYGTYLLKKERSI